MRNPLHHIKFLLTATNQHGVHSPFIYDYVTKCLYAEAEYFRRKSPDILFKSVRYFGATRVRLPGSDKILQKQLQEQFPHIQFETGPYDILFSRPAEAEKLLYAVSPEEKMHNDSLLLVEGIHRDQNHLSVWEKLKKHPKTTVTVDLYYFGAIFFRQEQAKEHFKIRI